MKSMEDPLAYVAGMTRAELVEKHPCLFLVKRPRVSPATGSPDAAAVSYETQHMSTEDQADAEAFDNKWWVAALCKRAGNPFPDRISIGRAANCDVVIRAPFVSKLHAHVIVLPTGELQIRDNRSANGTSINGRDLPAGVSAPLLPVSVVRLGAVRFLVTDAGALYDELTRGQAGRVT